jgi:hypothetical protein
MDDTTTSVLRGRPRARFVSVGWTTVVGKGGIPQALT